MRRVGIVGAGGMGNVHARHYRSMADVELYFYDRNAERTSAFVDRWDAKPCSDLDDLLKQVDVIDVCLPTPSHLETGLKAIAAGKALFVEKPLALSFAEAKQLVEAAQKSNVPFMSGHVVRFFAEYALGHKMVRDGAVGKPAAARARRGGMAPTGLDSWFLDHSKSGGVLLDLAIHEFDWLRWTLGEVTQVYSRSVAIEKGNGPDYALTTLTFENGCIAQVESTWMDPSGFRTTFEVAGSDGLIQHDSRQNVALRTSSVNSQPEVVKGAQLPQSDNNLTSTDDPYYKELRGFIDALNAGTEVPVTGYEGLCALAISEAAIESAKTGKVTVPQRL